MTKNAKLMLVVAVMLVGTAVFARPPHGRGHRERDGLDLANGIVDLVMRVIAPRPVVVAPPPQPVVVAPPPQPAVVAPQPVVVAPQPVVVAPQPVVVAPQPVYYTRPAPRPPHRGRHQAPARHNPGRHRR